MAKKNNTHKVKVVPANVVQEPMVSFITSQVLKVTKAKNEVATKNYTYKHFKRVMDKAPFTLAEWADLLFISERTLQRYAKSNTAFSGLQVERILHLEKLIDFGNAQFDDEFKDWLLHKAFYFNGTTPYSHLFTHDGIKEVYNLIGRMQYGTSA